LFVKTRVDCPSTSGAAFTALNPGFYQVDTDEPWLSLFVKAHV
jgi:hypothetical protein